jgi:hypothetical protein
MEETNMELKYQCFKNHINIYFVETGSYAGDGVQAALDYGFENIISIEVNPPNFEECLNRFKDIPNVRLIKGDSATNLFSIIKFINRPITFWLDAHYSGENSPIGIVKMPLLYELDQIRKHHIKNHTIIIDDVREWKGVSPLRDFQLEDIINSLKSINPNYHIICVDGTEKEDVLIATI